MVVLSKEINESLVQLSNLTSKLPTRIEMIRKEISLCEHEENDIKHKIELTKANAYQGYKLFRDLQITLLKRRELKDELATLEGIIEKIEQKDVLASHMSRATMSVKSREDNKKARVYSVRVRKDFVDAKKIVLR